ncbi:MAG: ATP-binding cassette domain-containing protein [Acidimicrobiales bacterium]|nr:ATP-binding cassette domain-containing protein [Hyphomonadaceae bacterium]RZV42280.1 MAG: ATP-binding cassette domain-containing protein [Acidimicrobiales bacterium]
MSETTNDPVLSIKNLTKSFSGVVAVNDVSFDIHKGEIVGFLGPNGAGKTTTLRMALGLVKPELGDIKLFNSSPGPAAFGRIGFLPEERGLYRKLKARDAIAHIARLNGMKGKAAFARADEMMDRYGLAEAKHKKIKTLSKGMAQKVQLIASIAHDPEFLILDEPFSGLDPVNQKLLENMVREIVNRGRTIIFSTHVMEHAERLCDRIILMSEGNKIFDGDLESALANAPRRLIIETPSKDALSVLSPLADDIQQSGDATFKLVLKPEINAQKVLEISVKKKLQLVRFEPERPSLHEAFVEIVAKDQQEIAA